MGRGRNLEMECGYKELLALRKETSFLEIMVVDLERVSQKEGYLDESVKSCPTPGLTVTLLF